MRDSTEPFRRVMLDAINTNPKSREALEAQVGKVWDTSELSAEFEIRQFLAPYCFVRRRQDGKRGTVMFQHMPRFFFCFEEE